MTVISTGTTLTTAFKVESDLNGNLVIKTGSGGTTAMTVDSSQNVGITTGNLAFTSTGQRITGDMSNATATNRLAFQSSTTNGNTIVQAIPNGSATQTNLLLYANTDLANTAALNIFQNATESTIRAIALGTASYTPMTFYTGGSERMRLDTSGNLGIGGTAAASVKLSLSGTAPSSSNLTFGYYQNMSLPSTTTAAYLNYTVPSIASGATVTTLGHFYAGQGTFTGAATNQYGFVAESSLTGATNNYGFFSNIASGSNRWNFYAAGTANNYFAGDVGVGRTPIYRLHVQGSTTTSANYALVVESAGAAANLFYVRNDGLMMIGNAANSPYSYTTGNAANLYVDAGGLLYRSTSSLRYKSDVSDATHGLADVLKLRSVTYKATNSGDTVFGGLIAEEVHDAGLTEFVAYDKEGRPDALHYGNMVALAFKAIQELKAENDALKARIEALEAK